MKKYQKQAYWLLCFLCLLFILDHLFPLPLPEKTKQFSTLILGKEGEPLRGFTNEAGRWCYPITLENVSPLYIQALLTYEDRWFWWHLGVNPFSLFRAAGQMIKHGRIISGGSTLTMQVARLLDPHQRSLPGKLKQILRAFQLEWHFSKKEILSLYLNLAPFGGPFEGVHAASLAYLGKPAKILSHAEAALLAILPQSPTRLRPDHHPSKAEKARNKVLDRLAKFKVWSSELVKDAKIERVSNQLYAQPMLAPLLSQRLKTKVEPGHSLVTTIDYQLQSSLETKLSAFASELPDKTSVALLVVENSGLQVRAYVGSLDFLEPSRFGQVDMVQALRSPGSTLKPFLYGFAIEEGLIHSESLLIDVPQSFSDYRPDNFNEAYQGPVSVRTALQKSLNIPAVEVLERLTPELFTARLRQGGLVLSLPNYARPNLSMILGGAATRLEDLVGVYSALARQGLSGKVRFTEGEALANRRLLSPGAAWIIRDILESHQRPDLPEDLLQIITSRRVAWKTGTSYGFRDAWAIGVTDRYTVGVWVGRPDGTPMPGYYGAITAAPILFNLIDGLAQGKSGVQRVPRPKNVKAVEICWPTGQPVDQKSLCHERHVAWILDNMIPPTFPEKETPQHSFITKIWINPQNGLRVDHHCHEGETRVLQEFARWPLLLEPFLSDELLQKSQLPPWEPACLPSYLMTPIRISGVQNHAILRHAGGQRVLPTVTLTALGGEGKLYWIVNGQVVQQQTVSQKNFSYQFKRPGEYQITLVDQGGHYDQINLKVIE